MPVILPPAVEPSSYLGQVATRCAISAIFANNANQIMNRSKHHATENITALQVAWANWYVATDTGIETPTGAAATITASIEYPAGTFTQLTFSGSATGTIPDGGTLLSDRATVTIPQGAAFYVRMFWTNSAGVIMRYPGANNAADAWNITSTDSTMSGTVTQQNAGFWQPPIAIVAYTKRPSLFLSGDSHFYGYGDFVGGTHAENSLGCGWSERNILNKFGVINAGAPGETIHTATGRYAKRLAVSRYCSHVLVGYGINDFNTLGRTAAQIAGDRATLAAMFTGQGQTVIGATLLYVTTSTDNWATLANQTVSANEAQRVAFNGLVRATIAGESVYIDPDFVLDPDANGKWPANGTAVYYTADGVHGSPAAIALLANGLDLDSLLIRTP